MRLSRFEHDKAYMALRDDVAACLSSQGLSASHSRVTQRIRKVALDRVRGAIPQATPEANLMMAVIEQAVLDRDGSGTNPMSTDEYEDAGLFFVDGRLDGVAALMGLDGQWVFSVLTEHFPWAKQLSRTAAKQMAMADYEAMRHVKDRARARDGV